MAFSIVLRRFAASSAAKPHSSPFLIPSVGRFFNTHAHMAGHSDDDDLFYDVDRRFRRFSLFPVVLDRFSPSWSVSHVRNQMDGTMEEDPYVVTSRVEAGSKRDFDVKQDEDALYIRVDMPGLGKRDVKLTVEQNILFIKGEAAKESEEGQGNPRRFSKTIELPDNDFELDMITAEMKKGVLKVIVPKMKKEDRKNVWEVTID